MPGGGLHHQGPPKWHRRLGTGASARMGWPNGERLAGRVVSDVDMAAQLDELLLMGARARARARPHVQCKSSSFFSVTVLIRRRARAARMPLGNCSHGLGLANGWLSRAQRVVCTSYTCAAPMGGTPPSPMLGAGRPFNRCPDEAGRSLPMSPLWASPPATSPQTRPSSHRHLPRLPPSAPPFSPSSTWTGGRRIRLSRAFPTLACGG